MHTGQLQDDTLGFGPTTPGPSGTGSHQLAVDVDFGQTLRGLRGGLPVFGGRFVLVNELGRGGMGVVWLALDLQLDRQVAIKFLPENIANDDLALLDLKRETRRCLELTHPNIVRVHDWLETDGLAGIAMEYIDGPSLSRLRMGRSSLAFTVEEVRPWLAAACAALEYAHGAAKVVHRDIKPSNLMLTSSGVLKLCDFGIARSLGESRSRLTSSGRVGSTAGSPPYMSPQHLLGMAPSASDDIYSVGATFYELLTGKPPFYSGSIERQIESVVPPPMTERLHELEGGTARAIPPEWEKLIAACLEKDPAKRPANAAAMMAWLDPTTMGTSLAKPQRPRNTARKYAFAILVTVALTGLTTGIWRYGSHGKYLPPPQKAPAVTTDKSNHQDRVVPAPDKDRVVETENQIRAALAAKNWTLAATAIGKLEVLGPGHPRLEEFQRALAQGQQTEDALKTALANADKALSAQDPLAASSALAQATALAPGDMALDSLAKRLEALRAKLLQDRRQASAVKVADARAALANKNFDAAESALQQAQAIDPNGQGIAETRQIMDAAKQLATAWPAHLPTDGFFELDALFAGTEYAGFKTYGKGKILEDAQRSLQAAGYFDGTANGIPGHSFQTAIIRWQREKFKSPAAVTGCLDTATLASLNLRDRRETDAPVPALVGPVVTTARPRQETKPKPRQDTPPKTARKPAGREMSYDEFLRKAKELENK